MLENRLDKAMIKYNEAMSIKKTYELIVKRLKDERVGYDNQLAAIEQSLKGKEHDFEELLLLSHDANHAKELAEADLRKFEAQIDARRKHRYNQVNQQKQQIESRLDAKDKFDKKDNKSDHRASTVEGQRFGGDFTQSQFLGPHGPGSASK